MHSGISVTETSHLINLFSSLLSHCAHNHLVLGGKCRASRNRLSLFPDGECSCDYAVVLLSVWLFCFTSDLTHLQIYPKQTPVHIWSFDSKSWLHHMGGHVSCDLVFETILQPFNQQKEKQNNEEAVWCCSPNLTAVMGCPWRQAVHRAQFSFSSFCFFFWKQRRMIKGKHPHEEEKKKGLDRPLYTRWCYTESRVLKSSVHDLKSKSPGALSLHVFVQKGTHVNVFTLTY